MRVVSSSPMYKTLPSPSSSPPALSLEFLELGSSSANLTGSLPRGDEVNSDPISLPYGFPFSNETESVVFVSFFTVVLTIWYLCKVLNPC